LDQDHITILRFNQLRAHGITHSRSFINRMVRAGRFPPQVELSSMAIGWRLSDVRRWLADRPVRDRHISDEHKVRISAADT